MSRFLWILGGIILAAGLIWCVFFAFFNGEFLAGLWGLVPVIVVAALLFGLGEGLELLGEQQQQLNRLEQKLQDLLPEETETEPRLCKKCGTQLPPGGHTCPTCHHVNK